jgi:hypothetical protein
MLVKLGAHEVPLKAPPSFALRTAVQLALGANAAFGLGAALGVCWGGKPLRVTLKGCGHSIPEYGAAVLDELHGHGIPEADLWDAASKALSVLSGSGPTEAGVEAAAVFSEPTGGASTP